MTDLQTAKNNLAGHTICLCKNGKCIYSDKRGISPMMNFIAEGIDLSGYSVADRIVGKATAMLFVKCRIKKVYAHALSQSGKKYLELYGVVYEYGTLTEKIINRAGTDICPMEKAVLNSNDADEAYMILKKQLQLMEAKK